MNAATQVKNAALGTPTRPTVTALAILMMNAATFGMIMTPSLITRIAYVTQRSTVASRLKNAATLSLNAAQKKGTPGKTIRAVLHHFVTVERHAAQPNPSLTPIKPTLRTAHAFPVKMRAVLCLLIMKHGKPIPNVNVIPATNAAPAIRGPKTCTAPVTEVRCAAYFKETIGKQTQSIARAIQRAIAAQMTPSELIPNSAKHHHAILLKNAAPA